MPSLFSLLFLLLLMALPAALIRRIRKKRRAAKQNVLPVCTAIPEKKPDTVALRKLTRIDEDVSERLRCQYIALDFETTGLRRDMDRVIQIGAVLFKECRPHRSFSTFVNPGMPIPSAASRINHISDDMVADAPDEKEAAAGLYAFLGDACSGQTLLCAHNAPFDMAFLSAMFNRAGLSATIAYVDTLSLARNYIPGLPNYKQSTVLSHLGLSSKNAHRADTDAEMCGQILSHILPIIRKANAASGLPKS